MSGRAVKQATAADRGLLSSNPADGQITADALMPKNAAVRLDETMSLSRSEGGSDDDETMITYVAMNQVVQGRDDQPRRRTIVTSSGMDVNGHIAAGVLMSRYRIDVSRWGSPHTRRRDDLTN